MSTEKDNGGPAFPMNVSIQSADISKDLEAYGADQEGMSLRDYFAAKAMQSLLLVAKEAKTKDDYVAAMLELPTLAYQMSDLMIKAKNA